MALKQGDTEKNKEALLDELGGALSAANNFINEAIAMTEEGKADSLLSSFLGISHQIGYMTAVFNQYIIFERGMEETERKIGFGSLLSDKSEK